MKTIENFLFFFDHIYLKIAAFFNQKEVKEARKGLFLFPKEMDEKNKRKRR